MKKGIIISLIILTIAIVIIFLGKILGFIIDIQWFKELGYLQVYFTKSITILKLMIPLFILSYICTRLFLFNTMKNIGQSKNKKIEKNKIIKLAMIVFCLFFSYYVSSKYWYLVLEFIDGQRFNIKDPIYNLDLSFYIFKLPLIEVIFKLLAIIIGVLFVVNLIVYFVTAKSSKLALRKLAILIAAIFVMVSIRFVLETFNLIYSPSGVAYGASYLDVKVKRWFYIALIIICLASSIFVSRAVLKLKIKPIIISAALILIIIALKTVTLAIVKEWVVNFNKLPYEDKYITNNIEYTRKAFELDKIKIINNSENDKLNVEEIVSNNKIVDNIRINSLKQTLNYYNQKQTPRNYYNFDDLDIDRYDIGGKYSQVFISPREIDVTDKRQSTWVNKHLVYTHGYGVVMNKVADIINSGEPNLIIKDIPTENYSGLSLNNPRIYFGEKTNDYAIVNTKVKEFDYPKGDSNANNNYDGKAGIKLSLINRIIFAIHEKDINFLHPGYVSSDSRILIERNIIKRAEKIAPFLKYDSDPYIIAANGKLYWIIDAYTFSDRYPYSQPYEGINYIRNSVKVVVDAYSGDINFYIVDKSDPIINSYKRIFKGLFKEEDKLPSDIRSHFRYPEDLFNLQCKVFEKYHAADPMVFMVGEDLWSIAKDPKVEDKGYVVGKLSGENSAELLLLNYFKSSGKENMTAMLAARMDGKNYGQLVLYNLPISKNYMTPTLFNNSINEDTTISKDIALWNSEGSNTVFGDPIIMPLNNSLLYIQTIYISAEGKNVIPEMKKVIVSDGEKIASGINFKEAVEKLFSTSTAN